MLFRYRYDTETGLYYLQSRYYNPEWGRFVNADAIGGATGVLLSHNLFCYCVNNPVNQSDKSGFIAPAVVYAAYLYAASVAASPDTARDLESIAMDLANSDYIAAGFDLVGVLIPGGTGLGQLPKMGRKVVRKLIRDILDVPHGNTINNSMATLYKKVDSVGNLLKWGITKHEDPVKRYTKKQIRDGAVLRVARGPRNQMLELERSLVETQPGPENLESWAGKRVFGGRLIERE